MNVIFSPYAWVIPLIPLLAFFILTAFGRQLKSGAVRTGIFSSGTTFLLSMCMLWERITGSTAHYMRSFDWIHFGDIHLEFGFDVTNINVFMLVIVTFISTLVNLYSKAYLQDDERQTVYYAYIALFSSSMLGLVLSPNLMQLYIFWELVGVSSFLLIGFWYERKTAAIAAKKAFIMTRIGDVGLFIAIWLLFWYMPKHALDFETIYRVFSQPESFVQTGMSLQLTTWIAVLIFIGAIGKSGQFPLHTWLPDAMEGPTPASALIHAATMVAAGIFLVAKTFPIFQLSSIAMTIVASVGGISALFAATIALSQRDIKRILAYSTISQLGYMMMALGLGSVTAGMFHLFTHACFKALLFLAAGSVIHTVHTQNIFEMGGIGRHMKVTMWTFGIGGLALVGIPPLSGFWSKDAILSIVWQQHHGFLLAVGLGTSFLTAFYMSRLFFLVFTGSPAKQYQVDTMHEAPWSMRSSLIVLSIAAVLGGFLYTPINDHFCVWLAGEQVGEHASIFLICISTLIAVCGLTIGYLMYGPGSKRQDMLKSVANSIYQILENKYYIDELYAFIFVRSFVGMGIFLRWLDKWMIAGFIHLLTHFVIRIGTAGIRLQSGQVQTYGLVSLFGLLGLVVVIFVLGRRLL